MITFLPNQEFSVESIMIENKSRNMDERSQHIIWCFWFVSSNFFWKKKKNKTRLCSIVKYSMKSQERLLYSSLFKVILMIYF